MFKRPLKPRYYPYAVECIITCMEKFEKQLTGGHPNSLGNTIQVVDEILKDKSKLEDLFDCYHSDDEVVRLRVSNGIRRVCVEHPEWVVRHLDNDLLSWVAKIDQPSTKWTLAKIYQMLFEYMDDAQRDRAIKIMQHNLETEDDWIVLNNSIESLTQFADGRPDLTNWLKPRFKRLAGDSRKSVAARAAKYLKIIESV